VDGDLVDAVLGRLGVARPSRDLDGLRTVYAAWCERVPFDNTLKLIHVAESRTGPLPGSTAEDFFGSWLELGTGGTCWAGNGALHDLLAALGFEVERTIATMLPVPVVVGPNHGSVVVHLDGERWIADASILSGTPIRIGDGTAQRLPRFAWLDDKPAVMWRMLRAPDGFPCRIDRIGATADEFDALHQRTAAWSPFNYMLSVRTMRSGETVGAEAGRRFAITRDDELESAPLADGERARFLVETMEIAESVARHVPLDREIPPRP
jgi:N-hydroxyarylamine O-acetyltransferase